MSESKFKLRERTTILAGQGHNISQSVAVNMVELGTDVAMLTDNMDQTQRFANNLMDMRQIHSDYGRAAAVEATDISNSSAAKDALSRAAELFGSVDICIDTRLMDIPSKKIDNPDRTEEIISEVQTLSKEVLTFLEGRNKGRIIFIINDRNLFDGFEKDLESINQFIGWMRTKAKESQAHNVTVNIIEVGLTEEYLLNNFPEAKSISEAKEQLTGNLAEAKLVDSANLANIVAFLASPMSSTINGQIVTANSGLGL